MDKLDIKRSRGSTSRSEDSVPDPFMEIAIMKGWDCRKSPDDIHPVKSLSIAFFKKDPTGDILLCSNEFNAEEVGGLIESLTEAKKEIEANDQM